MKSALAKNMIADELCATQQEPISDAYRNAIGALIFGVVCVSFSPIFIRLSEIGPSALGFWRVFLALPFFWMGSAWQARSQKTQLSPPSARTLTLLILCGVIFAIAVLAGHWALEHTSVANAILFSNMVPLYVAAVGWIFLGQRYSPLFLLGLALAFAGACCLVAKNVRVDTHTWLGDLLAIGVAISYGSYLMLMERLRQHYTTTYIMAWSTVSSVIFFIPFAVDGSTFIAPTTWQGWMCVVGIAIITQTLGRSLVVYALSVLPATYSSVALLLQPVLAAIWALYLLGEPITRWQLIGGGIILVGVIIVQLERRRNLAHS